MKRSILLALAFVLFCKVQSQKTIIRFEGLNDAKEKFYTVDIEGRKFHPASAKQTGTSGIRMFEINYLSSGSHDLIVYPVSTNTSEFNKYSQAVFNNRFQLKADHELVITVRNNGEVAFSEKPFKNKVHSENQWEGTRQPISMQQFNKLYSAMKEQFNVSDRYAILNSALDVPTNYFTIFQLNNLLSLINPESDRLILAKKASNHLLTEANASSLLEVFSSQSNRDALSLHLGIRN